MAEGLFRMKTRQQLEYQAAYQTANSEYGFHDRKITDGMESRGKRILSVGSGTGTDTWYLADENRVVGFDYAVTGLAVGQSHGVAGVAGDLVSSPTLPFADSVFDIVIGKDILEHLIEPLPVLQEVRRVLRDDGFIVVNVPNHFYLPLRLRLLLGKGLLWKTIGSDHRESYDEWNYMHIRFFTYRGLKAFLATAGFVPEKWFWDFGTLAHYANPDMWLEPQVRKLAEGRQLSRRARIGMYVIRPLWNVINAVLPRPLRSSLVSVAPGLLCASFYVRARKA